MNTFNLPQRFFKDQRKPWMPEIDLKGPIEGYPKLTNKSPIRPPNPQFDKHNLNPI